MKPYIVEMNQCHVLREPVASLIQPLADLVTQLSDSRSLPQIEVAIGDKNAALVFRHLEPLTEDDLKLFRVFGQEHSIDIYLQPGNLESVHKLWPEDNIERLGYQLSEFDLNMAFHPMDFTQVNADINRKMVALAINLLTLEETDYVLDAFCGIGNFSLAIARRAGSVLGLESAQESVNRATENARLNDVNNADFKVFDLFASPLPEIVPSQVNKVLVDPPRTGALELCKKLASDKVERLVYVSCNPKTLARDAQILVENGYQLKKLGIIDMFPHTTHVESIALFVRA